MMGYAWTLPFLMLGTLASSAAERLDSLSIGEITALPGGVTFAPEQMSVGNSSGKNSAVFGVTTPHSGLLASRLRSRPLVS